MNETKEKATPRPKLTGRRRLTLVGVLVLAIVAVVLIGQAITPKRSVAEYCKVYKLEKTRLSKLSGDTWPSGVFGDNIADASEYSNSFERLGKVAPIEIAPDVKTLESVYQKIHDEPSQALNASLSGSSADMNVKSWTEQHCDL